MTDETTQGKYILKDEKRPRILLGSPSVFRKLARGKERGLSGQSSAMESKGESITRGVANSLKAAETSKKI